MEDLVETLRLNNENCQDLIVNLTKIEFKAEEDSMSLSDEQFKVYSFKSDTQNIKNPKIIHAHKQFCKAIGIPYAFFVNNRPQMKEKFVKTWKYALDADSDKNTYRIKVRESDGCNIIRAIVPVNNICLSNSEIIDLVKQALEEPFKMEFYSGEERDDLVFHARFILNKTFEWVGEELSIGFSIVSSELGACGLTIEALIHHPRTETSYVASYGTGSYFSIKYDGAQIEDLRQFFLSVVKRIASSGDEFKSQLLEEIPFLGVQETCRVVSKVKGLPNKVRQGIYHEASEGASEMGTNFKFAKVLSGMSTNFEISRRIEVERVAGSLLNLNFSKTN